VGHRTHSEREPFVVGVSVGHLCVCADDFSLRLSQLREERERGEVPRNSEDAISTQRGNEGFRRLGNVVFAWLGWRCVRLQHLVCSRGGG